MTLNKAVVWMDQGKAHILQFQPEELESKMLRAYHTRHHLSLDDNRSQEARRYYKGVASVLEGASEILIVGPGQEKLQFAKYLKLCHVLVWERVLGVESVSDPTDTQLLAYAKSYFQRAVLAH